MKKIIKATELVNDEALSIATTLYEMCEDIDREDFYDTKDEEIQYIAQAIDYVKIRSMSEPAFAALYGVLDTLAYIGGN